MSKLNFQGYFVSNENDVEELVKLLKCAYEVCVAFLDADGLNKMFAYILTNSQSVRRMTLFGSRNSVSTLGIIIPKPYLPKLERLELTDRGLTWSYEGFRQFLMQVPNLNQLKLHIGFISDFDADDFKELLRSKKILQELKELNIKIEIERSLGEVDVICAMLEHMPNLRYFYQSCVMGKIKNGNDLLKVLELAGYFNFEFNIDVQDSIFD